MLDTASAREALWETIANLRRHPPPSAESRCRESTPEEDALDRAIDRYGEAMREQSYENARNAVRRIAAMLDDPPPDAIRVFVGWCMDAIGRDDA